MNDKKLVLDYSRWRCGSAGKNQLGEGPTRLLNEQGYSCCLGQFAPQLNGEITSDMLLDKATPYGVSIKFNKGIPLLSILINDDRYLEPEYDETTVAAAGITINDNMDTTPQEKIAALKELFGKEGYTIEVINEP